MKNTINKIKYSFTFTNIFRAILMFISSGLLFVAIIYLVSASLQKETKVKCLQFEQYSKDLPGFWITSQDKVSCDNVGITLDHIEIR